MRIDEILEERRPCFSFEFFPPKTEEGMENLFRAASELKRDEPSFEAMMHLTCVGTTVEQLREILDEVQDAGIENVLALRGDPPAGEDEWKPTEGGLLWSTQLAKLISDNYPFAIGAACFPEVHPEAPDMEHDIRFLKEKLASGVSFLITQLFYDNELYFDFVRECRSQGIEAPIIPGILPVTNYNQVDRIIRSCGASIPEQLERELQSRKDDPAALQEVGVAYASLQCADLLARGAPGIHFYTLNRSPATRAILAALRAARPWDRAMATV
jgi:methylenetetrahydrofolate reductase (NADPH)